MKFLNLLEMILNCRINETLRVSNEVRIFPLVDLNATKSKHVDEIIKMFKEKEMQVSIKTVDYEFQKGGNQVMRIHPSKI